MDLSACLYTGIIVTCDEKVSVIISQYVNRSDLIMTSSL